LEFSSRQHDILKEIHLPDCPTKIVPPNQGVIKTIPAVRSMYGIMAA